MLKTRAGEIIGDSAEPRLISLWPEAGTRLGLTKYLTYEAARLGQIPVLKFGRLLRVSEAVVDRMLIEGRLPSGRGAPR